MDSLTHLAVWICLAAADAWTRLHHSEIDSRDGHGVLFRIRSANSGDDVDFRPHWLEWSLCGFFPVQTPVSSRTGLHLLHHGAGGAVDDARILAPNAQHHLVHPEGRGFQKNGIFER